MNQDALVAIDEHLPGAFSFRIKVTESGALFLVMPRRDPSQPRFWCVVVVKCAPGGLVDPTGGRWLGMQGLHRDELGGTMTAIREDVNGWLAEPSRERLREWVGTAEAIPAGHDPVTASQLQPQPGRGRHPRQPRPAGPDGA